MILTVAAAALGWIVSGEWTLGLYLGGGVFLSWALTRELDPAHSLSAFVAAGLAFLTFLSPDTIQVAFIFWLLLLMRMINNITGKQLTLVDILATLGFTTFLAYSRESSLYFLIYLLALISLTLVGKRTKAIIASSVIASLLFIIQAVFLNSPTILSLNEVDYLTGSLLILTMLSVLLFWRLSKVDTLDDTGQAVDSSRLFYSQLLYCAAIILFLLSKALDTNDQLIHLAVISGIIFFHIRVTLLKTQ